MSFLDNTKGPCGCPKVSTFGDPGYMIQHTAACNARADRGRIGTMLACNECEELELPRHLTRGLCPFCHGDREAEQ